MSANDPEADIGASVEPFQLMLFASSKAVADNLPIFMPLS